MNRHSRLLRCAFVILGVVAVAVLFLPAYGHLLADEGFHFDRVCGRRRVTKHVLGITTTDKVIETPLSMQYRELIGEPPEPQWEHVSTRFFGGMRACNTGGPYGAARNLELVLEAGALTDEARKKVIVTFFTLVSTDDNSRSYDTYVHDLSYMVFRAAESGAMIDV